jgi:aromatic ring-cleaving dioxygenase
MSDLARWTDEIVSYHAHIYYHPETKPLAARLRERVGGLFLAQIGRWHDEHVGPHTRSMFQIAFDVPVFATLVPWLMLNRDGLAVLVHPNTDSPHDDHLVHALWLGEILPIDASRLPMSLRAAGETHSPVVPNTAPDR